MGHIPDGVFNFVGSTIEILSAPQRTIDELSRLKTILNEAREKQEAPEAVARKIRTEIPSLWMLADLLPQTRSDLYAFLALIVAVIALLLQTSGSGDKGTTITVDQTINQVNHAAEDSRRAAEANASARENRKIGSNDPCPCGSGRKHKKCHGRSQ